MSAKCRKLLGGAAILVMSLASAVYAATEPAVTILTPPVTQHIGSPLRVVFDAQGAFFVTDPRVGGVSKFDSHGKLLEVLKTRGAPQGIAFNDRGNLLVSQGSSVVILDQKGAELGRLGSGTGQFKKANGIAVDAAGYVYVADTLDNNVKVFTAAGRFVRSFGSKGTGPGQFSAPTGIAYEKSANQIAVADSQNGRVQFFSASGNFVKSIGTSGTQPLQFRSPNGVTFEYGATGALERMYVVDTYQNDVQVIDPAETGKFLGYIGRNGLANGQLMAPVDVTFDPVSQRLVVANGAGNLTMFGIDGGTGPLDSSAPTLGVDPVLQRVGTTTITISGTVESRATVDVTTNTAAVASPVVYTSSNTWQCSVSGLAAGVNELVVTARDAAGAVSRHALGVTYVP